MTPFRSSLELKKYDLHFDIHSATTPRRAGSDQRTNDLGLLIHFETIPQQLDLLWNFVLKQIFTGWWFGCHEFYFPIYILGMLIIPIDELIFFRGVAKNHQPV